MSSKVEPVVIDPIDSEVVISWPIPADRAAFTLNAAALGGDPRGNHGERVWRAVSKLSKIMQLGEHPSVDGAPKLGTGRLNQLSTRFHCDHIRDLSDLEHNIRFDHLVGPDFHVWPNILSEALQLSGYSIGSNQQVG